MLRSARHDPERPCGRFSAVSTHVMALVLAAGESSRMGSPKPLLPLNGDTFLGHLLKEIDASSVASTLIILGHHPEVVLSAMPEIEARATVNPNYHLGQLSSLHVGLSKLDDD